MAAIPATAGTSNPGLGWSSRAFRSEAVHRIAGVVTITGCLLVYGVLQERIMTVGFGPHLDYAAVSLTNVVSTSCQYEALKFVSFAHDSNADRAWAHIILNAGPISCMKCFEGIRCHWPTQ
ncbi:uncharacterized protein HaLaN_05627 [Haematococcus lacustris]|uniref:Uncharacterized protein n=1 Tax=Haematococcus lacustris TaxID=44745 RepID=A0A699YJQ1_HAELA|nr:uncharacterized protein HaLaN_05627 [Haematococcus lacustris]